MCNREGCSYAALGETEGWKPFQSVSRCGVCYSKSETTFEDCPEQLLPTNSGGPSTEEPTRAKEKWKSIKKDGNLGVKQKFLTLKKKIEVIEYANKKQSVSSRDLAAKFSCGKSQINSVITTKKFLLERWASNEGGNLERKHGRSEQQYDELNRILWEWYQHCRASNIPVSGPMLQEEALAIAERLGKKEFKASNGWLEKWKNQHNLAQRNVAGEEGDVNNDTVCSWVKRVKELTLRFAPQDIWNMDELGAFRKVLPEKSLTEKKKRCWGGRQAKQGVTVAFFVNAAGEKEPLIVIRKVKHLGGSESSVIKVALLVVITL